MTSRLIKKGLMLAMVLGPASWASADSLTLHINTEINNGNPADEVTAFFDLTSTDVVTVTLTSHLQSAWIDDGVRFNVADAQYAGLALVTPSSVQLLKDQDNVHADGDGLFDINVTLPFSSQNLFNDGDTISFQLTSPGLTAASFNLTSVHQGGQGIWAAIAHVKALTGGDSWVGAGPGTVQPVPLPAAVFAGMAMLSGLGGCQAIRRLRRN